MKPIRILLITVMLLTGCASVAPVPENISYITPTGNSGETNGFIGAWSGAWKGAIGHGLYVQEITPTHARVIMSWGEFQMKGFDIKKGYKERQGIFIGNDLFVKDEQDKMKIEITYKLNDNGTIIAFGVFQVEGKARPYEMKTVLHRVQDSQ